MSNALTCIKPLDVILGSYYKNLEDKLDDLQLSIIVSNPSSTFVEVNEKQILDIYYQVFNLYKGKPDLDDIISDISGYNNSVYKEIARIQATIDPSFLDEYREPHKTFDDLLEDAVEDINIQNDSSGYCYDLDEYVMNVLEKHRCFLIIPDSYCCMSRNNSIIDCNNAEVHLNNAQNYLFKAFAEEGVDGVVDYVTDDRNVSVWEYYKK
jgi:L-rhamnose mutarotase